jgi:hypothetical protein
MIAPPAGARILLATKPVDFRKGAHSLAALATLFDGIDWRRVQRTKENSALAAPA